MRPAMRMSWAAAVLLAVSAAAGRSEPTLPAGLGGASEPSLPVGLGGASEPSLPAGLGTGTSGAAEASADGEGGTWSIPFDFSGFADARVGVRTQNDPYEKDMSLGEFRVQGEAEKAWRDWSARIRADLLYDPVYDHETVDLATGRGWFDLREARVALTPLPFVDLKIGRQIITWGTGDLLFINDLFPKDWQSFFIGRDVEYLKAPSDAVVASFFSPAANLDLVYAPCFNADRYIDGSRLSYFNPLLDRIAGRDAVLRTERPQTWFTDAEASARLYRTFGGYELAAYGYYGFWKSPAGFDPGSGEWTFPRLSVYGLSGRGPVGPGIGNLECGWYDSRDDASGSDPLVKNGELRFLAGYEQELFADFNAAAQYYLEVLLNYDRYREVLPPGEHPRDEARHVLTLRLTWRLLRQNLVLSFFGYCSPSDRDFYLRPNVSYRFDDHWTAEAGANVFWGEDDWTFFGQFAQDSNVYLAARYGF